MIAPAAPDQRLVGVIQEKEPVELSRRRHTGVTAIGRHLTVEQELHGHAGTVEPDQRPTPKTARLSSHRSWDRRWRRYRDSSFRCSSRADPPPTTESKPSTFYPPTAEQRRWPDYTYLVATRNSALCRPAVCLLHFVTLSLGRGRSLAVGMRRILW